MGGWASSGLLCCPAASLAFSSLGGLLPLFSLLLSGLGSGFSGIGSFPPFFSLRLLNESRVFSFSFSLRFLVYLVLRLFQFGVAGSLFVALFIYLFISVLHLQIEQKQTSQTKRQ